VAHLHYVLIGGAIFPLFGAFYYWFPKWTGRLLGERLGWWNFALLFVGFHLTFFPMHQLGLKGMPRRVYSYAAETGWESLNLLATLGAMTLGLGVLVFLTNAAWSRRRGRVAGSDPWGAGTLEWATTSPPPSYNFLRLPTVRSLEPLWEDPPDTPVVTGLRTDVREVLVTTTNDAIPEHRHLLDDDSPYPPLLALVVGGAFIGFIFHPIAFPIGAGLAFFVLLGWFWPERDPRRPQSEERHEEEAPPLAEASSLEESP
jgi:cytochrome c oxidase subunit 1